MESCLAKSFLSQLNDWFFVYSTICIRADEETSNNAFFYWRPSSEYHKRFELFLNTHYVTRVNLF